MGSSWFCFDRAALQDLARARREAYTRATPFSHTVFDGLLADEILDRVVAEFPPPGGEWRHLDDRYQRKYGAGLLELDLGPTIRNVLAEFNSSAFVDFLQTLTGIGEPLIPDPHYRGGGLHQVVDGGYLAVHADFNRHPTFNLDRRVNVLVYLNRGWKREWRGELELWDETMSRAERSIEPVFNRTVIFTITDTAFHGHPSPLRCPEGQSRRSLAVYYYSNGRPADERAAAHSTLFQNLPTG